jgi:hypothetical protein
MIKDYISEDKIVNWIKDNNGILHTRKVSNINTKNLALCPENTIVCLTGYYHILEVFFNKIINLFTKKIILVTLETDGFDMKQEYVNHPLITYWFTWNKPYDHPKVYCLPIGLNYDRQQVILEKFLNFKTPVKTSERKLLCMNCSLNTSPTRGSLLYKAANEWKGFCDVVENVPFIQTYNKTSFVDGKIRIMVTSPKCYDLISKYKFILSPQGAGLDCHRTWEALYLDIIPIVLSSAINEIYEDLPILAVKDWNEITEYFLNEKYREISFKKERGEYNIEKMFCSYWINTIKNKIYI